MSFHCGPGTDINKPRGENLSQPKARAHKTFKVHGTAEISQAKDEACLWSKDDVCDQIQENGLDLMNNSTRYGKVNEIKSCLNVISRLQNFVNLLRSSDFLFQALAVDTHLIFL